MPNCKKLEIATIILLKKNYKKKEYILNFDKHTKCCYALLKEIQLKFKRYLRLSLKEDKYYSDSKKVRVLLILASIGDIVSPFPKYPNQMSTNVFVSLPKNMNDL